MKSRRLKRTVFVTPVKEGDGGFWLKHMLAGPPMEIEARAGKVEPSHDYKAELLQQLNLVGIPTEPEFRFAPPRRWRADWRILGTNILLEYEGGLFHKGKRGHSSVAGILRDIEKGNAATLNGFVLIRIAPNHVRSGEALKWIEEAMGIRWLVKAT